METRAGGTFAAYNDIWLLDGVRTPFVDYNSALGTVSPIFLNRELWQGRLPLRQLRHTIAGWSLTRCCPRSPRACARSAPGPA